MTRAGCADRGHRLRQLLAADLPSSRKLAGGLLVDSPVRTRSPTLFVLPGPEDQHVRRKLCSWADLGNKKAITCHNTLISSPPVFPPWFAFHLAVAFGFKLPSYQLTQLRNHLFSLCSSVLKVLVLVTERQSNQPHHPGFDCHRLAFSIQH